MKGPVISLIISLGQLSHMRWFQCSPQKTGQFKTDVEGIYCRDFSIQFQLSRIIKEPIRVPDATGQQTDFHAFFFVAFYLDKSSIFVTIGTSDHFPHNVQIDYKPMASPDLPFHRTVFHYKKAGWDTFLSYMTKEPLSTTFNHTASKTLFLISELILSWIEGFIPTKKKNLTEKSSQPRFISECHSSLLGPTLLLIYITDLPMNILW